MAGQGIPTRVTLICPRCQALRPFNDIDGRVLYRCAGCEWYFTFTAVAPTGTDTATLAVGGTALTVASGGASFTAGMYLLFDTSTSAEVLYVTTTGTATNIPVAAAGKAHSANATFGKLLISPSYSGAGLDGIPTPTPTAAELAAYPNAFD